MEVKWHFNGEEIPKYLEVSTSKMGKRMNVLLIESVKADHAGNYSCIAKNQAGTSEHTAPLIVIGLFLKNFSEIQAFGVSKNVDLFLLIYFNFFFYDLIFHVQISSR